MKFDPRPAVLTNTHRRSCIFIFLHNYWHIWNDAEILRLTRDLQGLVLFCLCKFLFIRCVAVYRTLCLLSDMMMIIVNNNNSDSNVDIEWWWLYIEQWFRWYRGCHVASTLSLQLSTPSLGHTALIVVLLWQCKREQVFAKFSALAELLLSEFLVGLPAKAIYGVMCPVSVLNWC